MADVVEEIRRIARRGMKSPSYMGEVIGCLDEHMRDAIKDGNATAAEAFAVALELCVQNK